MTSTLLLVIPQSNSWRACTIPESDWDDVRHLLGNFGASMVLETHRAPSPHYAAEITVEDHKMAQLIAALRPLLDEIVTRNTRYSVIPAER